MKSKNKRKLQTSEILAGLSQGKTQSEIAKELGSSRSTVSRILNADETKEILDRADSAITDMIDDIIDKAREILKSGCDSDKIKIMLPFLKTKGLVKDAVEHHHKFPKPTVLKYKDEKLVMGVVEKTEEDSEDDDPR